MSTLNICCKGSSQISVASLREVKPPALPEETRDKSGVLNNPQRKWRELKGLQDIAEPNLSCYKVWLLDQFGVLHDGKNKYPGSAEALRKLADTGAKLVLISNSSKRAEVTMSKLVPLGFDPSLFVGAITSGELTYSNLLSRRDPWFAALGRKCLHFTWSARGSVSLEGLGLEVVEETEEADFVLAHGTEAIGRRSPESGARAASLEEMFATLERCAERRLPMIVANPDFVTVEERALRIMPGTLGKRYEELGGEVRYMGKPDPVVYAAALEMAGLPASSAIAVGDSLHHDIDGAAGVGIDTVFVAGGIHADELQIRNLGESPDPDALNNLLVQHHTPSFVVPMFQW